MALKPLLTGSIADDASVITFKDGTGTYNAVTNPGGYESPNPAQNAITAILIAAVYYAAVDTPYYYRPQDFSPLFTADGMGLTPLNFSGIPTAGGKYSDGVYTFKYYVGFAGAANIVFTAGAKQFSMTGADAAFADAVAFSIPSNDPQKLYFIDRVLPLTSGGGYVTTPLPDITTPVAINVFYEGDLKLLNYKNGGNCLTSDLGAWSETGCESETFRDVWQRYEWKIAVEAKFSQKLFQDAHNLAVKLGSYCNQAGGGCSC
jgi:hypothetical protein